MKNGVILATGGGTTAAAILQSTLTEELVNKFRIAGLIASKPGIGAIEKLIGKGLPSHFVAIVDQRDYATEAGFGNELIKKLKQFDADLVGLHGWLPRLPQCVLDAYTCINQHPGGLDPTHHGKSHPDFGGDGMYGTRVVAAQLYFAQMINRPFCAEATTHVVKEKVDTGLLIHAVQLEIDTTWTVDELKARLLALEHQTQIEAWERIATEGLKSLLYERTSRLILPGEEPILLEAKARANRDYPKG